MVLLINSEIILLTLIGLFFVFIYPFSKRFIKFPQIILGITFSWSILIGWVTINKNLSLDCFLLFFSNFFWTIAYDTQYSMMDYEDDIKIRIYSMAVALKNNTSISIFIFQILFLIFLIIIGIRKQLNLFFWVAIIVVQIMFIYQYKLIKKKQYLNAFINNNYVGLTIFLGILLNSI